MAADRLMLATHVDANGHVTKGEQEPGAAVLLAISQEFWQVRRSVAHGRGTHRCKVGHREIRVSVRAVSSRIFQLTVVLCESTGSVLELVGLPSNRKIENGRPGSG